MGDPSVKKGLTVKTDDDSVEVLNAHTLEVPAGTLSVGTDNTAELVFSSSLDGLTDVEITSPQDQQILRYITADSKWKNVSLTGTLQYRGTFDASTGTPDLSNATQGDFYVVDTAGTYAGKTWAIGDNLLVNADMGGTVDPAKIDKVDNTDEVTSVFGRVGTVTASIGDYTVSQVTNAADITQNLADLADAPTARTNLGLGTAATSDTGDFATAAQGALADTALQAANDLSDVADAPTARSNLGVAIGSDVQAYNAGLADIAGLTPTDSNFIVGNGANWVAEDAATARTSLGLGSAAESSAADFLAVANNLSELTPTAATARTNLGLGTAATTASSDYATAAQGALADSALQPGDNISVGTITTSDTAIKGKLVIPDATSGAFGPVTIGSGLSLTGTTLSASGGGTVTSVATTLTGITVSDPSTTPSLGGTLGIASGGTGATTDADARTNLGLAIGTNVQAHDADLDAIAALSSADGNIIVGSATGWVAESGATARASLGLAIDVDVQGYTTTLYDIAYSSSASGNMLVGTGLGWDAQTPAQVRTTLGLGSAATTDSTDYATAAQGALADTALQQASNLGDVADPATSRTNLSLGTANTVQFNELGLGTAPAVKLHVQENSVDEIVRFESTDATAGANSAPDIAIKSAKQTALDYLGAFNWYGQNDLGATELYARIGTILTNPANGAEAGAMFLQADVEGNARTFLYLEGYTTGGTGQMSVNYNAKNIDFRVLNDASVGGYSLYADASTGYVGINENAPQSQLHIVGKDDDNPEIRIERPGVTSQYLGLMNEDLGGAFVSSYSSITNKKGLFLQSLHTGSGGANGDAAIYIRTGADGSETTRMTISDELNRIEVQSGTYLLVDDNLRVGSTNNPAPTDYSISAYKSASTLSGGLFSSSVGESAISNTNAGWWLTAGGMNTTSKYTPAIKFGSTDEHLTTDNPKWLAGIIGRATQTYSSDTTGAMALDFLTFPSDGGASGGPTVRMTIDGAGNVGIGIESPASKLHIVDSDNPELRLQESGQNGYTSLFGYADNYGALRVNNATGTESTLLDLDADSNGTGAQTIRLFRTSSATASATKLQILSPGSTTETFAVDANTGDITTAGGATVSGTTQTLDLTYTGSMITPLVGVASGALQTDLITGAVAAMPVMQAAPGPIPTVPTGPYVPYGWMALTIEDPFSPGTPLNLQIPVWS